MLDSKELSQQGVVSTYWNVLFQKEKVQSNSTTKTRNKKINNKN